MTEERVQALEVLCQAATEGPWEASTVESIAGGAIYGQGWTVASATIYLHGIAGMSVDGLPIFPNVPMVRIDTNANAAFIAEARTALPELIAEVRRLREQLRLIQASVADFYDEDNPEAPEYIHDINDILRGIYDEKEGSDDD